MGQLPPPVFSPGDSVQFKNGYLGPVDGIITKVWPPAGNNPEPTYDFTTDNSGHARLNCLTAPKQAACLFTPIKAAVGQDH